MVHKEGPDTRYTYQVLNMVIRLRLRSIAISRLFRLRCMGPTSRIWSCAPLHVSIWLYHRRHAPQIQAKLTMSSWRSPRSEPRRFAVIDQGPLMILTDHESLLATTPVELQPTVSRHHGKPRFEGRRCGRNPFLAFTSFFEKWKRVVDATFSVDCRPSRTSATSGTLTCGQNNMDTILLTPQPVNHELYHSGSRL